MSTRATPTVIREETAHATMVTTLHETGVLYQVFTKEGTELWRQFIENGARAQRKRTLAAREQKRLAEAQKK